MRKLPSWTGDIGLLILRSCIGSIMLLAHGLPKLLEFSEKAEHFPDPLGVGSAASLSLAISGELVAAALLVVGLATRVAAVPLMITMLVAAFVVHSDDPWSGKEHAILFAVPALALVFTGPGRFSVDQLIWRGKSDEGGAKPPVGDGAGGVREPVDGA